MLDGVFALSLSVKRAQYWGAVKSRDCLYGDSVP